MARTPSQRALLLVGVVVAAAIVVLVARRGPEDGPAPEPSPRSAPATTPPAPTTVTRSPPTREDAGRLHVEGQGHATVEPSSGETPPPPDAAIDDPSLNPPIEPERPQTPEWKLERTARLVELIGQRLTRLEQRIREAESRGDAAAAEEARILLERSRRRQGELRQEMESLREQIRADGGTPPELPERP